MAAMDITSKELKIHRYQYTERGTLKSMDCSYLFQRHEGKHLSLKTEA
jgi:hypothetical protein